MIRRLVSVVAVFAFSGCVPPKPPPPLAPRAATSVSASMAKTWDAAVGLFADENIGIRTIDRASGLIVADPVRVPTAKTLDDRRRLADCGSDILGTPGEPKAATYNVLVRGDSSRSTVKVTARWLGTEGEDCTSQGVWERDMEAAIKARAEGAIASADSAKR